MANGIFGLQYELEELKQKLEQSQVTGGMKEKLEHLQKFLLNEASSKWIVVHGVGGVGKTLLARMVREDEEINRHFNGLVFWLTLGQTPDVEGLREKLLKLVTKDDGTKSLMSFIDNEAIATALSGKRCLLILDGVWKAEDLPFFDVVQERGSKILLTCRRKVPTLQSSGALEVQLGVLGEEDSQELFCAHAFPEKEIPGHLIQIMHEVVRECGGLPLALKVMGCRMVGEEDIATWEDVRSKLEEAKLFDVDRDMKLLKRLEIGYDALPSDHHRECFLYFAAFPQDASIDPRDLIKCWKGEGLIHDEDEANSILGVLKEHALIDSEQAEMEWDLKRTCKLSSFMMQSILRDLAFHILDRERRGWYFRAGKNIRGLAPEEAFSQNSNRISLVGNMIVDVAPMKVRAPDTVTLLLDLNPIQKMPNISSFINLRVLSLKSTFIKALPESVGELRSLVTLDLSHNEYLETVPGSLKNLTKLAYLDLSHCCCLEVFPVDALFKFTSLIYFDTRKSLGAWHCRKIHWFDTSDCLDKKTLRVIPTHLSLHLAALSMLTKLWVDTDLIVHIPASIGSLACLRLLHLRTDKFVQALPSEFQRLTDLEDLSLSPLVQADWPPSWDWGSFSRLRVLHLKMDVVTGAPVTVLTRMQHLRILSLEGCRFEGLSYLCNGIVPRLEELELRRCKCNHLLELPALNELVFLKRIEIEECTSLSKLPTLSLPRLERLFLHRCSPLAEIELHDCSALKQIEIRTLPRLRSLSLSSSTSTSLLGISLPCLESLTLWNCTSLSEIAPALRSHRRLQELRISGCCFEHVPVSFHAFPMLKSLEISDCASLRALPNVNPGALPRLQELTIKHCNKIERLPRSLLLLPTLETLRLSDLDGLKDEFKDEEGMISSVNLRELHLWNVDLRSCGLGFLLLKILRSSGLGFPLLKSLKCGYLRDLPEFNPAALPRLEELEISFYSKIERLPQSQSLSLLTTLQRLKLQGLELQSILDEGELGPLVNLRQLTLRDLGIRHLPKSVATLPRLEELDLQGCKNLESLPCATEAAKSSSFYPCLSGLLIAGTSINRKNLSQRLRICVV